MIPVQVISKLVGLAMLIVLLANCTSPSQETAKDYDYQISTELMNTQRELYGLLEIMGTKNRSEINQQLTKTKKVINISIDKIKAVDPIKKDFGYKKVTLQHLHASHNSLVNFYPEIIRLSLISSPNIDQTDALERLLENLEDIEEPIDEQLTSTRKKFCEQYEIEYLGLKND